MESKAEQYYPTYRAKERDVILIEFEEAQKIANGQTKVYGQVTNVLLAIMTFVYSFLLNEEDIKPGKVNQLFENTMTFSAILFLFGAILLRYFVDLQKQITINARKVVTLRTLLGLDYGYIHLTLPNWMVEGATNPFVIKYFNGWLNFKTMPFWLLTFGVNISWWLSSKDVEMPVSWIWGNVIICVTYFFVFRRNLNDRHETTYLSFVKLICLIFRIKLLPNFEYILYRAKLAYLELDRLNVNYNKLSVILVEIEDRNFLSNKGVSYKSLFRAFLSRFGWVRRKFGYAQNGGSTITMQLTRSLFIPAAQNKYLRKIAEVFLSLWLNRQFTKPEILKLYISSVRYDKGVLGLGNSIKHFFGEVKQKELSLEESFFLVERLSNITSSVNWERVKNLATRISEPLNESYLRDIYQNQINLGRIRGNI